VTNTYSRLSSPSGVRSTYYIAQADAYEWIVPELLSFLATTCA
jgi:hypothetical protein